MNAKKESLKEVLEEYELYSELRYPDDLIDDIIGALDACSEYENHARKSLHCQECINKDKTIRILNKQINDLECEIKTKPFTAICDGEILKVQTDGAGNQSWETIGETK